MDAFGPRLDYYCERQGITLKELATLIGVHRNTIDNWKARGRPPNPQITAKLAEVLNLNEEETNILLTSAGYAPKYLEKAINSVSLHPIEASKESSKLNEARETRHQPERHDCYPDFRLPVHYIRRTHVLSTVRGALIGDGFISERSSTSSSPLVALHGMAGIGKSVIARALCDDSAVRASFPHGILWVTLGKAPKLITGMRTWIDALGGTISGNSPTIASLQQNLLNLLRDRACLLILDDVWHRTDAERFLIGGTHCRYLLTTRDTEIAYELGAMVCTIPPMTEPEAVRLLESWADRPLANTPLSLEEQVVKRLGHLPLAVKLAGAQLRRQSPDGWLRNFTIHKLKSSRPETIHDDLTLTFELSLEELDETSRCAYTALAIFKEDETIPQQAIERLWQGFADLTAETSADLLNDFASRALLEVVSHQYPRSIRLHDLLRDLISIELGDKHITAHEALLKAYRITLKGVGWHTVEDDGYLYDHLSYHLQSVGAAEELKELFANQNWMQVRVPQRDYTYDGYLEDLSIAWTSADTEVRRQIESGEEPSCIIHCIRYLLIRASMNSHAQNSVPELVKRAVEEDLWTPHRALSVAAKIPDVEKRASMYAALLSTNKLSQEAREKAQRLGLEAALNSQRGTVRSTKALAVLAPYLTGKLLQQGWEAVLELDIADLFEHDRENVLQVWIALAPHLTNDMLEQGLETILAGKYRGKPIEPLATLAPYLPEKLLERGLEAILAWEGGWKHREALVTLVPYLPEKLLERGLEAILAGEYEGMSIDTLVTLTSFLTGRLPEQGLEADLAIKKVGRVNTKVLSAMAPRLGGELLAHVLEGILKQVSGRNCIEAIVAFIPHLSPEQSSQVLEHGLNVTLAIPDDWQRIWMVVDLAPFLLPEQRSIAITTALDAVLTVVDEEDRAQPLAALAPYLTPGQRAHVLEVALALADEQDRIVVLTALAPYLTSHVLEIALTLRDEWDQMHLFVALTPYLTTLQRAQVVEFALLMTDWRCKRILVALAPYLTGKLLERGLEIASVVTDKWALVTLAPYFPEGRRYQVLEQGLEIATRLTDQMERGRLLTVLVPYLSDELLERALEKAIALPDEKIRANTLSALVAHLPGRLLERVLEVTLAVVHPHAYEQQVTALAPHLPTELQERVLEMTFTVEEEWKYTELLFALAPYLTDGLQERAIETALRLTSDRACAQVLSALAPRLSNGLQKKALEITLALATDEWARAMVLAALAPQLPPEQCAQMQEQVLETALTLEEEWEREPLIRTVAPHLADKLLKRALEIALALTGELRRANALIALAPRLTSEQRNQMLGQALEITLSQVGFEGWRLKALAPSLTNELSEQGLKLIPALNEKWERAEALEALIPQLEGELLEQGLEMMLTETEAQGRAHVLVALLPTSSYLVPFLSSIWQAIADDLLLIQHWSLQDVFLLYLHDKLFRQPLFSEKVLGSIALVADEICNKWRWL